LGLLAGLEPATSTFEASRSSNCATGAITRRQEQQAVAGTVSAPAPARCSCSSLLLGEDRVELSPRVPKTRMLALHHTPEEFRIWDFVEAKCFVRFDLCCRKDQGRIPDLLFGSTKSEIRIPKSEIPLHPFTQTTCFISATIFTRSLWLRITALMSL